MYVTFLVFVDKWQRGFNLDGWLVQCLFKLFLKAFMFGDTQYDYVWEQVPMIHYSDAKGIFLWSVFDDFFE